MTRERWQQVCDLLEEALELEPQQRPALLDRACDADPSLRQEVEVLLASSDHVRSSFLQSPPLVEPMSETESSTKDVLAPGAKLGPYLIHSLIGSGGMGEVYRARDTELKREVAIKVLPEFWSRDPERLHRFELEAQAAAALNHPNIISIHHVGQYDGSPYIVTELLQGETLRERLRRGPIPVRKVIEYAVQIANGLAAAHDRGIVHRDLKPENLFVTKDGRVKILDFGLARLLPSKEASGEEPTVTQKTGPGVVLGTAGYMSPEQVRSQPVDHRADIFAFGTILYEMVTGKQPFRKSTSAETMTAILNEEPPSISQITPAASPGMQRVVHRCLEKDREQRFHSAHDLAFALEALSDSTITTPSGSHAKQGKGWSRRRITVVGATALVLLVASSLAYLWLRPERVPKVSNYVQLTHDGQPKRLFGTDGPRLYLDLGNFTSRSVGVIPISGGEITRIPAASATMLATDLSPDGSQVLVVDQQSIRGGPLWSLPVLGGAPRRLGNVEGQFAAWSSDGKMLAYSDGGDLFVAKADGTEAHKLVALQSPTYIDCMSWSPDDARLRFDVSDTADSPSTFLWEVSADGTNLHRLFPGWHKPPEYETCGAWTANARYFVFFANDQVWALPQKGGFFHAQPKPIQLTSTYSLFSLRPSKDGKKLFVSVWTPARGELMRYDSKSGDFANFLGGISAEYLGFSKDGQWVAYISFPDGTLWRSKIDGSERLQLTYPPNYAMSPRWSPDGKKIVFYASPPNGLSRIFEVSPEGGTPRQLMPDDPNPQGDPNWSPDGSKILFDHGYKNAASAILVLDLETQKVTTLPGSQGLFSPRWSPNGRYIVALTGDFTTFLLFDFETQKWTQLLKGDRLGWPNWSKDGQYVYYTAAGPSALRMRISDRKVEPVADLTNFRTTGRWFLSLSLTPDDSPLLLRDATTSDIYSLDWEEP